VIYTQQGAWEDAEAALTAAVEIQPDNVISHHLRAGALTQLERFEEAAAERRQVIALGEDVWQQWTALADVEARSGNVDEARAALGEARARVGSDAERAQVDSLMAALGGR
jgi:predicted Zn-dependent protease